MNEVKLNYLDGLFSCYSLREGVFFHLEMMVDNVDKVATSEAVSIGPHAHLVTLGLNIQSNIRHQISPNGCVGILVSAWKVKT